MKMNSDVERGFKNIIKGVSDARPVLQCVHFEKGCAIATDSHRAFRVRKLVPEELALDLNLAKFTFPKVNYPNMDAFFNREPLTKFEMTVPLLRDALPAIKALIPGFSDVINLEIKDDSLMIRVESNKRYMNQTLQLGLTNFEGENLKMSCKHKYLLNGIQAITGGDFYGNVQFKFGTNLQPFVITRDNLDYLITPVRVFSD
ncbi:hypothetical protein FIV11_14135 [Lactiplantibacillus plantarum]|uniref:hypothetical protein n=1 Tax=Lactiplantibacillus plantarum TaxID=1590 RepID=UPI0026532729|nr:hypothetical protein [Lactiplantibacillus plantarum]MDN7062847.1 hypothetical protein [Lactiplantibacillus plantarum]